MNLEEEIQNIKIRNQKVEADKAWERSWLRSVIISSITYLTAVVWLVFIGDTLPFLKAFAQCEDARLAQLATPELGRRASEDAAQFVEHLWKHHREDKVWQGPILVAMRRRHLLPESEK